MRRATYFAIAALSLGLSAEALAQGGGFGGGTGGTGGGMGGGSGGGTGGGSSFSGGSGGSSFSGSSGSSFSGSSGSSFSGSGNSLLGSTGMSGGTGATVPGRTGAGGRSSGGGVQLSSTNFLSYTSANPMYPGRPGSTNTAPAAGGFGQPSFGNVSTTTTNRTAGGRGGVGGTASVNSNMGRTGTVNTPITFAAEVRFPVPAIQGTQVQSDLQELINRTSILKQPDAVRVEVNGTTVILRGRVANDDERRLVEGMVRLEPGVHNVKNELTLPPK